MSLLRRFSSFSGAGREKLVEISKLPLVEAGHARCAQRQMPWFSVQKTAKVPQLQRSFKVADVPVVQVVLVPQVHVCANSGSSTDSVHRPSW